MKIHDAYEDDEECELVCEVCGESIMPWDMCTEHGYECICKACCPECREEDAYWDAVNNKIDIQLGK